MFVPIGGKTEWIRFQFGINGLKKDLNTRIDGADEGLLRIERKSRNFSF